MAPPPTSNKPAGLSWPEYPNCTKSQDLTNAAILATETRIQELEQQIAFVRTTTNPSLQQPSPNSPSQSSLEGQAAIEDFESEISVMQAKVKFLKFVNDLESEAMQRLAMARPLRVAELEARRDLMSAEKRKRTAEEDVRVAKERLAVIKREISEILRYKE